MHVIIPMAGTGDRFIRAGYRDPKPLITVNGKRIIKYIVEMFDKTDDIIFICNDIHIDNTNMYDILKGLVPNCKILSIPAHTKGPVYTIIDSKVLDLIDDDEEVIVCYCDNPFLWNYSHFKNWVRVNNSDGCILSHVGFHPHRLSSTYMAYMKLKPDSNIVEEIKEKQPYTNNHMSEHASTGTYYFKRGSYVKKYFKQAIDENINYNGEHYVTLVYNLLMRDNLLVHCYPTDHTMVFGTPEEVQNFVAWQTILNSTQVKSEDDLIKCYRYWKSYNDKRNTP